MTVTLVWLVSGATLEGQTIRHDGQAAITVELPDGMLLAGVSLIYDYENAQMRPPFVRIEWRGKGQEFGSPERWCHFSPTGDRANWEKISFTRLDDPEPVLRCWMWCEVTELRITPDYIPGTFELKEMVVMIPKQN